MGDSQGPIKLPEINKKETGRKGSKKKEEIEESKEIKEKGEEVFGEDVKPIVREVIKFDKNK